jgi:Erythromycin biosynthesis protein CIII-like, N-terminal domain
LAEAGHDVAFASGEPVAGEAEADGLTAFRGGLDMDSVQPLARRVRDRAASLPGSQVRHLVFTELFVRGALEPRPNDLINIVGQWAPDVAVPDVAEFAAPLLATMVGIPDAEHSYGPAILNDDTFRDAAYRIKNPLDAMPDPQQAVETLEQLEA